MPVRVCVHAHVSVRACVRPLPGVVHLVGSPVVLLRPLPVLRGRLQLPVVKAQQEHLRKLEHGLALLGCQVAELVLDEVQHPLVDGEGTVRGSPWAAPLPLSLVTSGKVGGGIPGVSLSKMPPLPAPVV